MKNLIIYLTYFSLSTIIFQSFGQSKQSPNPSPNIILNKIQKYTNGVILGGGHNTGENYGQSRFLLKLNGTPPVIFVRYNFNDYYGRSYEGEESGVLKNFRFTSNDPGAYGTKVFWADWSTDKNPKYGKFYAVLSSDIESYTLYLSIQGYQNWAHWANVEITETQYQELVNLLTISGKPKNVHIERNIEKVKKNEMDSIESEKIKKNLHESKIEEERKKANEENEKKIKKLEAYKQEQKLLFETKLKDSLEKRNKEILDSLNTVNTNKKLANELSNEFTSIIYTKNLFVASKNWKGTAKNALEFKEKYLPSQWRFPTVDEMKDMIDPSSFRKHYNGLNFGFSNWHKVENFLCVDSKNEFVILNVNRTGGSALPVDYFFKVREFYEDRDVIVRFVKDK